MICTCPAAAALPTIPAATCPENFGQIQKVVFQRIMNDSGIKNFFDSAAEPAKDIKLLATWTPLLTAADSTKVVVSPYIQAPTAEPGKARTFGGGNETLGGIEIIVGRETTPFTGVIRQTAQSIIKTMKDLQCEATSGNLGIYLIDENGNIGAIKDVSVATKFYPIPISSLFISDKGFGGLEAPDLNNIQWSFLPNWSDNFAIVTPSFNPLTDLKPSV